MAESGEALPELDNAEKEAVAKLTVDAAVQVILRTLSSLPTATAAEVLARSFARHIKEQYDVPGKTPAAWLDFEVGAPPVPVRVAVFKRDEPKEGGGEPREHVPARSEEGSGREGVQPSELRDEPRE